jgi:hypothetical protein
MAYFPPTGSVVAFQGTPANLKVTASIAGTVQLSGTPSISGAVDVSNFPTNQSVSGAVQIAGKDPSSITAVKLLDDELVASTLGLVTQGLVYGKTTAGGGAYVEVKVTPSGALSVEPATASVIAFQGGTRVTSLVSTIPSSVIVGASIFGLPPVNVTNTNLNVGGSVVAFQGAGWSGSVAARLTESTNASVITVGGSTGNSSVMLLNSENVVGSIATLQGTNPWVVVSSLAGGLFPVSGSVAATITNTNVNVSGSVATRLTTSTNSSVIVVSQASTAAAIINTNVNIGGSVVAFQGAGWSGSVAAFQAGTRITSISGIPQVSVQGAVTFLASSIVSGHGSVNGVASVQVLSAPGAGLFNYVTDFTLSNTGAATTLVTFTDGDASIIGRSIAPTGGGAIATAISSPMKAGKVNGVVNIAAATATSVLYAWVGGYRAP